MVPNRLSQKTWDVALRGLGFKGVVPFIKQKLHKTLTELLQS